mmetsp:Transcript_1443/g.3162  ORF Transcript_1443/g.3162 Transcript_1443/m.3162 type:complete len:332 (+) Transcript_1443:2191-3186(+)
MAREAEGLRSILVLQDLSDPDAELCRWLQTGQPGEADFVLSWVPVFPPTVQRGDQLLSGGDRGCAGIRPAFLVSGSQRSGVTVSSGSAASGARPGQHGDFHPAERSGPGAVDQLRRAAPGVEDRQQGCCLQLPGDAGPRPRREWRRILVAPQRAKLRGRHALHPEQRLCIPGRREHLDVRDAESSGSGVQEDHCCRPVQGRECAPPAQGVAHPSEESLRFVAQGVDVRLGCADQSRCGSARLVQANDRLCGHHFVCPRSGSSPQPRHTSSSSSEASPADFFPRQGFSAAGSGPRMGPAQKVTARKMTERWHVRGWRLLAKVLPRGAEFSAL